MTDDISTDGDYICTVCDTAFESARARKRHLYSEGLLY